MNENQVANGLYLFVIPFLAASFVSIASLAKRLTNRIGYVCMSLVISAVASVGAFFHYEHGYLTSPSIWLAGTTICVALGIWVGLLRGRRIIKRVGDRF